MARTRLQYTILAACVLITALFIIHEVLSFNKFGTAPIVESIYNGRLFPSQSTDSVKTVGGAVNHSDGCQRLWVKGRSSWFDTQYDEHLSPLWSMSNKDLPDNIKKWWLSIQSSKSENLAEILTKVFQIIPPTDPYHPRDVTRCLRCAVVGNSGNLRKSKYGKLIDSHDIVIRINKAVLSNFQEDVGSKETHRIMYPESAIDLKNETYFVLAAFKPIDVRWVTSALTDGSISTTYMRVRRKINSHRSKVMIFNPALLHHIHTVWQKGKGRYPSTGAIAIFMALYTCDEVNVFGFGPTKNGNWDHYWEPPRDDTKMDAFRKSGVHNSDTESEIWRNLEREGKIKLYLGVR